MSEQLLRLDPTSAMMIADEIRLQLRMNSPVLNPVEAMQLVGKASPSAFGRWCRTYKVKNCGQGRYARRALEHGLNKEAKTGHRK